MPGPEGNPVRVACPRCHHIVEAEPGEQPVCPNCGFVGSIGSTPPPTGFSIGSRSPQAAPNPQAPPAPATSTYGAYDPVAQGAPYGTYPATSPAPAAYDPYYQAPQTAHVRPYGGFWIRVVSWFLDQLVVGVPLLILTLIIAPDVVLTDDSPLELPINLLAIVTAWLYRSLMESSRHQASLGKLAVGLRVTDLNGRRISFGRATGRYFATILSALILFIGYFLIAFTQRKQGLHDMIAGTLVYKKDHVPQAAPDAWSPSAHAPPPI